MRKGEMENDSELKFLCGTHANSNSSDCPKYATERKNAQQREREKRNERV